MSTSEHIKNYVVLSVCFIALDYVYLSNMSNHFGKLESDIQGSSLTMRPEAVVLCYTFLTTGLYYFGILRDITLRDAFLLGIYVYGVYESTNYIIFNNWKQDTVIIDTLWGGVLFSGTIWLYRQLISKI